jgi:hypothetical protein
MYKACDVVSFKASSGHDTLACIICDCVQWTHMGKAVIIFLFVKRNIAIYCRYFIEHKCDIRWSTLRFACSFKFYSYCFTKFTPRKKLKS